MAACLLGQEEDAGEYQRAEDGGGDWSAESKAAMIQRLVEEVTHRGAERARQDEGGPEQQRAGNPQVCIFGDLRAAPLVLAQSAGQPDKFQRNSSVRRDVLLADEAHLARMNPISAIALSGLNASTLRLRTSASNIAKAQTQPAAAAVDMVAETVELAMASHAFAANLAVLRTADDMERRLLDLKV